MTFFDGKKFAIETFASIISGCNEKKLLELIDKNVSLIETPGARPYVSTIKFAMNIPFFNNYLREALKLNEELVLGFIKEKNPVIHKLLCQGSGRKWFSKQFNDWFSLIK